MQEAEWDLMREKLLSQIRASGGWIPQSPTPGAAGGHHTDYAARSGQGIYHASHDGHTERYIKQPWSSTWSSPLASWSFVMQHSSAINVNRTPSSQNWVRSEPPGTCRFIDSAEELERDGIVDPEGRAHLAQLLGHLYDLKVVSYSSSRLLTSAEGDSWRLP